MNQRKSKMKNKVLGVVFGGLLLMAAAAPTPPTKSDSLAPVIEFCAKGLVAFRSGEAGKAGVRNAFNKMDPDLAKGVAVVCRAYTAGYDEGQRDILKNTT
jgi:hypothetical protein